MRTHDGDPGNSHLQSWLIETSADRKSWGEADHNEDNGQLNGTYFTGTFAIAGNDDLSIRAREISANLIQ
jgi:hypothetical protein